MVHHLPPVFHTMATSLLVPSKMLLHVMLTKQATTSKGDSDGIPTDYQLNTKSTKQTTSATVAKSSKWASMSTTRNADQSLCVTKKNGNVSSHAQAVGLILKTHTRQWMLHSWNQSGGYSNNYGNAISFIVASKLCHTQQDARQLFQTSKPVKTINKLAIHAYPLHSKFQEKITNSLLGQLHHGHFHLTWLLLSTLNSPTAVFWIPNLAENSS
ncbi:hypothetical protein TRFO_10705 [Tritrichomonas foetus]|uniref:Uncharacterized protein n=1 Tax=Tritrichomonas foetus TaxID=1144522 RepID=A0A1J4J769_9EUKA|nr:hypothetical protein TRFO_10705 [Tritrichomonas foetus]|eukprot:OHS95008.1 hypothetical protein TRFO_10705 [Tritrichomonas foetus]